MSINTFTTKFVACLAITSGFCNAATIYNSFLPGNSYVCCGGSLVSGTAATNGGQPVGLNLTAAAFTPTGNFNLTQIDVALYFANSGTNGFILSLNLDNIGVPGSIIQSWSGLTAPPQSNGTSSIVQTVFPVSTVQLLAGQQYWIVASPAASDSFDIWAVNGSVSGPGGREARSTGAGWTVFNNSVNGLAFDVQGSPVPEPKTLSLFGLGLFAILARHKAGRNSTRANY